MSTESAEDHFESSDGDVRVWIEQGSAIHIKAISEYNDPVELNAEQALELAQVLQRLARRLSE